MKTIDHLRKKRLLIVCIMVSAAACKQAPTRLSEAECEARYKILYDEYQQTVEDWSTRVTAARGTAQYETVRLEGAELSRRFLPKFDALAAKGCGIAKCEYLDLLSRQPHAKGQAKHAIQYLSELVYNETGAWWISDLGDDDVVRYFLQSSVRARAIELFEEFVKRTSDKEARRSVLFELGVGRIHYSREASDTEAGLRMLRQVIKEWPESRDAETARGVIVSTMKLQIGQVFPLLEGSDVDGVARSLGNYRGRVVVVDFFGFWCVPCISGLPALRKLVARHPSEAFAVLGVNAHDDEATLRRGLVEHGVTWPCIFDGKQAPLSKRYGITAFPAVFVVDGTGTICAMNPTEAELERLVEELVRGR